MTHDFSSRRLVLASGSPRRRELMTALGLTFEVFEPQVDETITGHPRDQVLALAIRKSDAACPAFNDAIVICADTLVAIDGDTLGKPHSPEQARDMIQRLSGRDHQVLTGLCVTDTRTGERQACVDSTTVRFRVLTPAQIDTYIASGEPMGKAGAYAIQGAGGAFVEYILGSRNNVIGLPTEKLMEILNDMI